MLAFRRLGMKIYIKGLDHMIKMIAMPINGKYNKTLLLQNHLTEDLEP